MPPQISVIIPAYNHEAFISEAIASVLNQSCGDFELIIIDDGSSDATRERIAAFTDSRIRFFTQENRGAAATLNRGVELARGRYISILNSDDRYHPERLAALLQLLENNPEAVLAVSAIAVINAAGQMVEAEWLERGLNFYREYGNLWAAIIRDNFICTTSNLFACRELFDKIGPFLPLRYCHDLDFILKAQSEGEIFFCDDVLLDYRVHEDNTIKEISQVGDELFKLEVAGVIAAAIMTERFSRIDFPGFTSGLLDTQLGQLLDLVGLFCCYPEDLRTRALEPACMRELLPPSLQKELLDFIAERNCRQTAPWKLYQETEKRYNEKQELVQSLVKTCGEFQKKVNVLNEEIEALNELVAERQRALDKLQWKAGNQEAILNEIYSSKGWLWLSRYRRFTGWLRQLAGKLSFFSRGRAEIQNGEQVVADTGKSPVVPAYKIEIANPLESDRPKIVHAIANVLVGGSTQLVVDIYERLGHKYDQVVATMHKPEQEAYQGLPVVDFSGLRNARQFASFLEKQQAEILHIHYWGECDEGWYRKVFQATELYHCPVVENINIPVAAYLHPNVVKYVFVSQYITGYTKNLPAQSLVIYPGSHLEEFDRRGAPVPDDVIGMVYRLEPDKLNEESIEVFIEVVKRRPATRVRIVGGGSLLEHYQRRVREEALEQAFDFTGYVAYRELPSIYRTFSIFVAPVWRESFGQVSTFAMSMELPVVGFQVAGGILEMTGQKECFAADIDGLATLIVELLDDRQRRLELGRANRERALELFSVTAMTGRYDQVYQQILVPGRGSS